MISIKDIDESLINDGIHPETGQPLAAPQAMNAQSAQPQASSRLAGVGNSLENAAIGAGDSLQNFFADVGNLALPKGNNLSGVNLQIPQAHLGDDSLSYKVGRGAGDVLSFVGGGEVADTLRAGMEGAPLVGKLAQSLGGDGMRGVARRAVGTGTYGAVTNPDNRAKGFAEGAALSPVMELAPALVKGATTGVRPQAYAEKVMEGLSGNKSLEENTKSLAESIKKAFDTQKTEGKALYQPVFDALGGKSIYESGVPFNSAYQNLDHEIVTSFNRDLTKVHEKFLKNPTLQNAHELQSQLGADVRKFEASEAKGSLSAHDRNIMMGYQDAREALQNDADNFLRTQDEGLADQYKAATKNWAENVIPYLTNSKLAKIAKGDIANPRNIANIFKNPEEDIQKVVGDLDPSAAHKIVYSEIGKIKSNLSPERLLKALNDLDSKGLGSYVTPQLENAANTLSKRIRNREWLQKGAGLIAGAKMGIPAIPEVASALGGAVVAPSVAKSLDPLSQMVSRLMQGAYPAASTITKATVLPGAR